VAAFNDLLQATLTLTCGDKAHSVVAGAIETIDLTARRYGFECEVGFWVSSEGVTDELFASFTGNDVLIASLQLANGTLVLSGDTPVVTAFTGYVTARRVRETTSADIQGEPIIERLYTVRWTDAASANWRQHRPLAMYSNSTLASAIAQQAVDGVQLDCDWTTLSLPREVVCIGLGGEQPATFYDFIVWLATQYGGVLEFDYQTNGYRLGSDKTPAANSEDIEAETIAAIEVMLQEPKRHSTAVLNPFSDATVCRTPVSNDFAANGVRQDVVAYTPIEATVAMRAVTENSRLKPPLPHVLVTYSQLPTAFCPPGQFRRFGEGLSPRIHAAGKTYRAIEMRLLCGMPDGEEDASDLDDAAARFGIDLSVEFERDIDPVPQLPAFTHPKYPVFAEGKFLSASGTATDRTWHIMADDQAAVTRYRVHVPLWNQTVMVPFLPTGESGHFFFPAYKNQRVLLSFDFDQVRIAGFLDWAGRLALDSQGNQIVMGKRDASSTVVKHQYTDDSPILTIVRTQQGDMQTMELSEGRFFLEVKEDEVEDTSSETYDLSPLAEAAKEAASSQTQASVGALSGKFQSSTGKAAATLDAATSELEGGVDSALNELSDDMSKVETTLSDKASDLQAKADELSQTVAAAKSKLKQLGEDS
jgi:hypothetical protein